MASWLGTGGPSARGSPPSSLARTRIRCWRGRRGEGSRKGRGERAPRVTGVGVLIHCRTATSHGPLLDRAITQGIRHEGPFRPISAVVPVVVQKNWIGSGDVRRGERVAAAWRDLARRDLGGVTRLFALACMCVSERSGKRLGVSVAGCQLSH